MVDALPLVSGLANGEVSKEEIDLRADEYNRWNFDVEEDVPVWDRPNRFYMTGYEDVQPQLQKYTSAQFHSADAAEKERIIDEVTDIYEEIGIFPIKYFSHEGIVDEVLKCYHTDAGFTADNVVANGNAGASLCSWRFPSLWSTPSAQDTGSAYDKFYTRDGLRKIVSFNFNYNSGGAGGCPGTNILSGVRMTGSVPTNFKPMNAQAIFERFTPFGGTIWDPCTGFGGRLLGALTSKKNFSYVGTDPSTEVMHNLHKLAESVVDTLEGEINSDGSLYDSEGRYELHCCGAEELELPDNSIDFVFTSPPYADLELYSHDGKDFNSGNQSTNKFPGLENWKEGFVRGVIRRISKALKPGSYCAINIADFSLKGADVHYVDDWTRISIEEGLTRVSGQQIYLGVRARSGSKLLGKGDSMKKENILLFQKPSN